MKYTYREGLKKPRGLQWTVIPLFAIVATAYVAVNYFAPVIYYVKGPADRTAKLLITTRPEEKENKLYIPKINVTVDVLPIESSEAMSLENGAIQRAQDSGNPKEGGTYVLTAQRLSLEPTPERTYTASPFYHLSKVADNDDIYLDYEGVRYAYKVLSRSSVNASDTSIESRDDTVQLVLYPTQVDGMDKEKQVVKAKMVGRIIWVDDKPRLKAL